MSLRLCCRLLPALLTAAPALGATPAPPALPDPADPKAAVPRAEFRSPLAGYRRHAPEPVASWQEVNRNVNRIGGWRTYLREAATPEPAASASVPAPHPAGHQGHGKP
jgi:hypothetical protein